VNWFTNRPAWHFPASRRSVLAGLALQGRDLDDAQKLLTEALQQQTATSEVLRPSCGACKTALANPACHP
jgi:hypothetical protein